MQKYERNLSHNIEKLKEHKYFSIQKVFASPHYIILSCRAPGETFFLYVGKGARFNGVWYCNSNVDAKYRIRDRWNQYFKKHVVGLKIDKVWIENDIIACFQCEKIGTLLISYFNSSLKVGIRNKDGLITLPWGEQVSAEEFYTKEINKSLIGQLDIIEDDYMKYLDELNKKYSKGNTNKLNKKIKRKISNIDKDLSELKDSLSIWDKVIEGEIDFSQEKYRHGKLKMKFDKDQSYESRRNDVLNKLKRYKKAIVLLEERRDSVEIKSIDLSLECEIPKLEPEWRQQRKITKKIADGEFRQYQLSNYIAYVGVNAKSNDFIRNTLSTKNDWWFHDEANPSQHVILKCQDERLDINLVEQVGQLFLLKDENHSQVNLIFTKVKYLKSVKGKPGLVRYSKEKSITVFKNQDLMEKITLIPSES
ncbi:MAG: DUF814 domain-containing protein [Oligoflexia bacterium]|nr:DUF814 domain-containing protein [Oligoflexia bacterium]